ncbi:MAG: hypothetical protein ABS43_01820 [Bordetella sp. SCN 67-23]|nr:hypothetical protein [Burkholderiales bacterium]ODS76308.1 MAG: hypothetical protein ABS43_01820 [Bordetella sp. SCN 67-23]OJW90111.1 MAG: hypothetical protein BGO71_27755 [Burkholderiales bacterium 67-32]
MTTVILFPANRLGATVCPIFNGHTAIVSSNTDRLIDGKYDAAELALFRHNCQGTSFLNPLGVDSGENANYGPTIIAVSGTGRISFGLYYRTDRWVNPNTGSAEAIPDYNLATWTTAGVAAFSGATLSGAKPSRYPNHGQQMFDISGGAYGYDVATKTFGASGGTETFAHTQRQLDYFESIAGIRISSASYANGRNEAARLLIPHLLGVRNSSYSYSGTGLISYDGLSRLDLMDRRSTTRAWDAVNAGDFPDVAASMAYVQSQVRAAIAANGWYTDFVHWHSVYDRTPAGPMDARYFDTFYGAVDEAIDSADVWRAGNNEAAEYYWLRGAINKLGSYVDNDGSVRIAARFADHNTAHTDGIPNTLPASRIQTPISIRIDLAGTPLAGQNITCEQAQSIRSLGSDQWIVNIRAREFGNGYYGAVLRPGSGNYYSAARPILTASGSTVVADQPCKFVVWRKPYGGAASSVDMVSRTVEFAFSVQVAAVDGYDYYVGAITRSRMSSVLDLT